MSLPHASPTPSSWLVLPDGAMFWLNARCSVGRQPGNDLVFGSHTVSRQHALLTASSAGGYSLSDLRSSNGTFVNGDAVSRATPLRDGDAVRFGEVEVRFRCTRQPSTVIETVHPTTEVTRRIDNVSHRTCWLLVADIAGSTKLNAELGPEKTLRHVQAWIAGMRPLIEDYSGQINSYAGDGFFAWWPADKATPERVLAAIEAIEAWRPKSPVSFRVVLHHGSVLCTRSERGEELSSQDVNFVFRAEKLAKSFGVDLMLSEAAVTTLQLGARCPPLGAATIDGIPGRFVFFGGPRPAP